MFKVFQFFFQFFSFVQKCSLIFYFSFSRSKLYTECDLYYNFWYQMFEIFIPTATFLYLIISHDNNSKENQIIEVVIKFSDMFVILGLKCFFTSYKKIKSFNNCVGSSQLLDIRNCCVENVKQKTSFLSIN